MNIIFEDEINSFRGEYSWLSNFHKCDCWYDSKLYPSSEHLYQALKATNEKDHEYIRTHPFDGLKSASRRIPIRENWNDIKLDMMEIALASKFENNPDLKKKLLDTGDMIIVEGNDWCDNFYGVCKCPKCEDILGLNHLGRLLMRIRKCYRSE